MHPLQIMGTLNNYYRRILRCDDPAIATVDDAIAALGGRISTFPARKLMEQARALGIDGIREAFDHLYQADLDLKGARGIPEDAVMDVLVVRLARLAARSGAARSGRSGPGGLAERSERRCDAASERCYSARASGALHEARRAAGGLVLVDPAEGRGLVDALLRQAHGLGRALVAGVDRGRWRPWCGS